MANKNTPKAAATYPAEIGSYNEKPLIVLKSDANDKFPFQFGIGKAKKIVAHFDAIRAFVESNGAKLS